MPEFGFEEPYAADLHGTRGVLAVCSRLVDRGEARRDKIGFEDLGKAETCVGFGEKLLFALFFGLLVSRTQIKLELSRWLEPERSWKLT